VNAAVRRRFFGVSDMQIFLGILGILLFVTLILIVVAALLI
jgi:hypothetical protein